MLHFQLISPEPEVFLHSHGQFRQCLRLNPESHRGSLLKNSSELKTYLPECSIVLKVLLVIGEWWEGGAGGLRPVGGGGPGGGGGAIPLLHSAPPLGTPPTEQAIAGLAPKSHCFGRGRGTVGVSSTPNQLNPSGPSQNRALPQLEQYRRYRQVPIPTCTVWLKTVELFAHKEIWLSSTEQKRYR